MSGTAKTADGKKDCHGKNFFHVVISFSMVADGVCRMSLLLVNVRSGVKIRKSVDIQCVFAVDILCAIALQARLLLSALFCLLRACLFCVAACCCVLLRQEKFAICKK